MLALAVCLPLGAKQKIAGSKATGYTIVYNGEAEAEEGLERAGSLQQQLSFIGSLKTVAAKDFKGGRSIVFAHDARLEPFGYAVTCRKGTLTIWGGGSWAMEKAAQTVANKLKSQDIANGFSLRGTVEGQFLFPFTQGANLRILDDNVWNYKYDTIPDSWKKLGTDCRNKVRAPQYAQLVKAYMPDIINLQEYGYQMHQVFFPMIEKLGYKMAYEKAKSDDWDQTPIFYNAQTVELIDVNFVRYAPPFWATHSKSCTSAVFKHKATGRIFAVLSTHLWWQGDGVQPGSTFARVGQANTLMAEQERLKAKYNCTYFITGDMNCYESEPPIQQYLSHGYVPCYKAATVSTDNTNGHHICSPDEGFSRKSNRRSADRTQGAIDHCFIYNAERGVEVKAFKCEQSYFLAKLTDHYPNIIDIKL